MQAAMQVRQTTEKINGLSRSVLFVKHKFSTFLKRFPRKPGNREKSYVVNRNTALALHVQHLEHQDDIHLGLKTIQVFNIKIKQVHRGIGYNIVEVHLRIFDISNVEIK